MSDNSTDALSQDDHHVTTKPSLESGVDPSSALPNTSRSTPEPPSVERREKGVTSTYLAQGEEVSQKEEANDNLRDKQEGGTSSLPSSNEALVENATTGHVTNATPPSTPVKGDIGKDPAVHATPPSTPAHDASSDDELIGITYENERTHPSPPNNPSIQSRFSLLSCAGTTDSPTP